MLSEVRSRLEQGDRVLLASPAATFDLTLAFAALLSLLPAASSLARYSQVGRRGSEERIVAAAEIDSLRQALQDIDHAFESLDLS